MRKFHACLDAKSNNVFYLPSSQGVSLLNGPRPPCYLGFTITLRHTTLGRIPVEASININKYVTTDYFKQI